MDKIRRLFARMKAAYGYLWTGLWKSEEQLRVAALEWALELRDHPEPAIEAAFERAKRQSTRPPNLVEFRALLDGDRPLSAAHREAPRLPRPPADKTRGAQALAAMREKLRST